MLSRPIISYDEFKGTVSFYSVWFVSISKQNIPNSVFLHPKWRPNKAKTVKRNWNFSNIGLSFQILIYQFVFEFDEHITLYRVIIIFNSVDIIIRYNVSTYKAHAQYNYSTTSHSKIKKDKILLTAGLRHLICGVGIPSALHSSSTELPTRASIGRSICLLSPTKPNSCECRKDGSTASIVGGTSTTNWCTICNGWPLHSTSHV